MSYSTLPLSEAQILHLLLTSGPGVPPALEYPPTPPDPPSIMSLPRTHQITARRAVTGLLGLGLTIGLLVPAFHPTAPAPYYAVVPTVEAAPAATATSIETFLAATSMPAITPTLTTTSTPSVTAPPPMPPPATATEVVILTMPPAPPRLVYVPPTATPAPPPSATAAPLPPPVPTNAAGSGEWGNDWSNSIFDRSATIGAPTPAPTP